MLRSALARLEKTANADTELLGRYLLEGGKITDFQALGRALQAANADTKLLRRYLLEGGKITDFYELGRAFLPTKRGRGKPADTSEAAGIADDILFTESRWRKAHPGHRLPRGYRPELLERHVQAALRDDGQLQSGYRKKSPADRRLFEQEYKDAVRDQILNSLENKRKNRSR
jgi:hypothetical protein